MAEILTNTYPIRNAGLVLLNSYLPILFERTKLTQNDQFINAASQYQAVGFLQYIVTGYSAITDQPYPLFNLLCGLPVLQQIFEQPLINETDKELIEGMLHAAINQWTAIGGTSIAGFRESFIERVGLLWEGENSWALKVEKRAYDILIDSTPFSFSIIKLPWMQKPLQVELN